MTTDVQACAVCGVRSMDCIFFQVTFDISRGHLRKFIFISGSN